MLRKRQQTVIPAKAGIQNNRKLDSRLRGNDLVKWPVRIVQQFWHKSLWNKVVIVALALLVLLTGSAYGVARWYQASVSGQPLKMGASFIPAYAESLGLDAQQTMDALINDLGIEHFRLVSYWNQMEPEPSRYDFSLLDWQFEKAEKAGATVTLSLGLRQPRWPECHMPDWAGELPDGQWQPRLQDFIAATVNRYKTSPALASYQLENEYFLRSFGHCTDFDRQRLVNEYSLVKSLDPLHPIILSRSNNVAVPVPLGQPVPDQYGLSVYRRIWQPELKRYFQYPFPAWYYAFLAGTQKLIHGRDSIIHELQAEAWPPNGQGITQTSLAEQNKSLDAKRLADRFDFGRNTGIREIYLWGAEYWYYRKQILNDPSLWQVAKQNFTIAAPTD